MSGSDEPSPVVLVTGGARRIGAAIVQRFHAEGYRVIIHCNRSASEAAALKTELEGRRPDSAEWLQADLNRAEAVQDLIQRVPECFGRLDVLVNNASRFYATSLDEADDRHWDDLIDSNVRAAWFLIQGLVPHLRRTRGSVVSISDSKAARGISGFSIYSMAKAALETMTRSLARELAPEVRVNAVAPGAILWPEQISDPESHAGEQAKVLAGIPAGHLGNPGDIAGATLFLARDGGYVTGQVLRVDGGRALS